MFILSVDNMNPSDQMITLVAVHVFLSIARKFLTWSVAFSVVVSCKDCDKESK